MIVLIFLLIAPEVYGQEVSQNDFYGLWESEYEDVPFYYFINSLTLTLFINYAHYENWSFDILSWRTFLNQDISTKDYFPYGFDIVVKSTFDQFVETRTYLINRDKNKMFWLSLPDEIYIKKSH